MISENVEFAGPKAELTWPWLVLEGYLLGLCGHWKEVDLL